MHFKNQPRFSLTSNLLSQCSNSEKQNSTRFIPHTDKNIQPHSLHSIHGQNDTLKDPTAKIVQWRKNRKLNVVCIKACRYSMIKTSTTPIELPTTLEVEKISYRLNELKQLPISESMFVLSSLLEGYANIRSFFGYTAFQLRFCGINGEGKVKAWINSDFQLNQPEGTVIKYESECVSKLIQEVKKISATQFSQFYTYYLRNARKNLCDFKYTSELVKSYCSCMKLPIPEKIYAIKKQKSTSILKGKNQIKTSHHIGEKFEHRGSISSNISQQKQKLLSFVSPIKKPAKPSHNLQKNFSLKSLKNLSKESLRLNKLASPCIQEENEVSLGKQKKSRKQTSTKKSLMNPKTTYTSNIIKQSQVSTNYNTQSHSNNKSSKMRDEGVDWAFTTFNKVKNFPTHYSQNNISQKSIAEEEKSPHFHYESREIDCTSNSSASKTKQAKRGRQAEERNENEGSKTNWTNTIDNLFTSSELKQSRVVGKEPGMSSKVATDKLDRWARVIGQSMLQSHNNYY